MSSVCQRNDNHNRKRGLEMLRLLSVSLILAMLVGGCDGVSDVDCSQDCYALCEPLAPPPLDPWIDLLLSNETEPSDWDDFMEVALESERATGEYMNCLGICSGCGPLPQPLTDAWLKCTERYLEICYGPFE